MAIPVVFPNNSEGGYSTDYSVAMMRQGMKMAFPDDDIQASDGSTLTNESAEVITPDSFDGMVEVIMEDGNLFDRLNRRGICRGDVPAVKAALGDAYPKHLPDEVFSVTPSKNGLSLVQEGFLQIVGDKLKKAMLAVWKMLAMVYRFLATKVREAAQRIYDLIFRSSTYIGTVDEILADVQKGLGSEWPEFERRLSGVLTAEQIYAELNARGAQLNLDYAADKAMRENARALAAIAGELSEQADTLLKHYLATVDVLVKAGNADPALDDEIADRFEQTFHAASVVAEKFLGRLKDAGISGIDVKNVLVSANAVEDFVRRQGEKPEGGKVYTNANWVERFKQVDLDSTGRLSAIDTKGDMVKVADRAGEIEKALGKAPDFKFNDGFVRAQQVMPTCSSILLNISMILMQVSRHVIDYELVLQGLRDTMAKYRDLQLKSYVVVLEDDLRWKSVADKTKANIKQRISNKGIGKILTAPNKEVFSVKDGELVSGKDAKDVQFLSFKEEAAEGEILIETTLARDADEIMEAQYRTTWSESVSAPDEALYRELRQKYMPTEPSDVSLEGFGILKMAVIGAIFVAAYKALERLVRWIKDLLMRRKGNASKIESQVASLNKTEDENLSIAAPTEKMMSALNDVKANAAMHKAAGLEGGTGQASSDLDGSEKPLSVQDKMRAVSSVLEETRQDLLKSPSFGRLQDAADSISVGYLQDQRLENIVRLIRQQRPERVAYLADQCREIDLALTEQRNTPEGEVAPRLARLWTTMEQGRQAYSALYNEGNVFTYGNLSASGYIPKFDFASFGKQVFDSATPVYPSDETVEQIRSALASNVFLVFAQTQDEVNNDALKRFGQLETQFKKLRDVAQQVKSVPEDRAAELRDHINFVSTQLTELAAWYSFEEALRGKVQNLVDSLEAYVKTKADIIEKRLAPIGLKDWTKK